MFDSFRPVAGVISMRENGSLVAFETGQVRLMHITCF
jgi:predicted membrane GTPase involved in stress response